MALQCCWDSWLHGKLASVWMTVLAIQGTQALRVQHVQGARVKILRVLLRVAYVTQVPTPNLRLLVQRVFHAQCSHSHYKGVIIYRTVLVMLGTQGLMAARAQHVLLASTRVLLEAAYALHVQQIQVP